MSLPARVIATLVLLCATCTPRILHGQAEADAPAAADEPASLRLEDFRLSGPPALSLLGMSASSVSRPNTPRALIASLVSASGSSGLVPGGYALETSPYWLVRHPALEIREYYHASPLGRLRYFTAFSAATSRASAGSDSVRDPRVSIAVRTLVFNGHPSPALVATFDSIRTLQLAYIARYRRLETARAAATGLAALERRLQTSEDLLSTLVTKVLVGPAPALRDSTLHTLARRDSARAAVAAGQAAVDEVERLEKEIESLDSRLARLAERFGERDAEPDGFILEAATGIRGAFAGAEWDRARWDGMGVWITPMYRFSGSQLEIIGVGRYLTRVADYADSDVIDLGARAGWVIGRGTISGEWARRRVRDRASAGSSRWAGLFDYKLPTSFSLVASFGSDFRGPEGKRPVIATLGLNLGIGAVMLVPSAR